VISYTPEGKLIENGIYRVLFLSITRSKISFWLCRIVGAVFIMLGLYLVLWGKNEERKLALEESQQDPESLTKHLLEAQHKKSNSESEV